MKYLVTSVDLSVSATFLVPLLGLVKKESENFFPFDRSYLFWDEIGMSIENYEIGLLYKTARKIPKFDDFEERVIVNNTYVTSCYDTNAGTFYIFDLSTFHDTVDKLLLGKYSRFDEKVKKQILKYWGEVRSTTETFEDANLLQSLYPSQYFKLASEEIGADMAQVGELCPIYNKDFETFPGIKIASCFGKELLLSKNSL